MATATAATATACRSPRLCRGDGGDLRAAPVGHVERSVDHLDAVLDQGEDGAGRLRRERVDRPRIRRRDGLHVVRRRERDMRAGATIGASPTLLRSRNATSDAV